MGSEGFRGKGSDWEPDFRRHLNELTLSRLRVALWIVMITVLLDGTVQYFVDPDLFRSILGVRISTLVASVALLVLSHRPWATAGAFALSFGGTLVVAADVEAAIVMSGGYHSLFQTGLTILLVAVGLLFPYGSGEMAIACALIWSVYLAPLVIDAGLYERGDPSFWVNGFFLVCASGVALTASHLGSRLRRQEYFSRRSLEVEQQRSEHLLLNILPAPIAARLKAGEETISDSFNDVTVMFADVVGFTPLSERLTPSQLVDLLNELFSAFDRFSERHGVEKVKTIGDAYMVVGGIPVATDDHAEAVASLALDMVDEVARAASASGLALNIRIGIHTGPAIAGVIGKKKFAYDLWGDTVNTASRMESHGLPGRIQVSESTWSRLRGRFDLEERGVIPIKGKGDLRTFFLVGRSSGAETPEDEETTDP